MFSKTNQDKQQFPRASVEVRVVHALRQEKRNHLSLRSTVLQWLNKRLFFSFQDQEVMQAFQDVSQNPQNISKYDHLPKVKMIIDKLAKKFGPAGEGPPPDTEFPGGMPFGDIFGGQ